MIICVNQGNVRRGVVLGKLPKVSKKVLPNNDGNATTNTVLKRILEEINEQRATTTK